MPLTPGHHPELPIEQVHVSDRNPRKITDQAFDRLKHTLTNRPDLMLARPLICLPDGEVIGGNMRLKAALQLGWETIPVFVTERVSDAERREAITLDNQPFGEWIPDELAALVADHERDGADLTLLGFADAEINDLLKRAAGAHEQDPGKAPSDDPMMNAPERADVGDIWQLGDHYLAVGDALEPATYDALFHAAGDLIPPTLAVTSPPYNQKIEGFKPSGKHADRPNVVHRLADAYSDNIPEPTYQDEQVALLELLAGVLVENASLFYNHKIRFRDKVALHPLTWIRRSERWALRQEIVWDRGQGLAMNARMFNPMDERIYWLTNGSDFHFNDEPEIRQFTSVWKGVGSGGEIKVGAPFPVELPSRAIRACSSPGDIVLDPYMGTGTTLMACEHLSRHARCIEIQPRYADVTLARWEAHTARKAERVQIDRLASS